MNYLLEGVESQRLLFRRLLPGDFETWLTFFQDPASTKYWNYEDSDPAELCKAWFAKIFWRYENNRGGMNVLIDKKSQAFVGQCGLLLQVVDEIEELEVGYSIMPEFRNRGYATEASSRCIAYAFEHNIRDSIISIINENNLKSEKVAFKNQMRLDKKTIYAGNPVNIYRINSSEKSNWKP